MTNFNLNGAIAQWRERLSWRDAFTNADLDEMESHLRDEVESLVASGITEQQAFHQTIRSFDEDMKLAWRFNQANWEQIMLKRTRYAPALISNYFKVAIRNLFKHKTYSITNIAGLAVGIVCSLLIFLFVQDELSYDIHHQNAERIHRVIFEWQFDNEPNQYSPTTPGLLAPTLINDVPGIEHAVRFAPVKWYPGALYMQNEQNGFWEENGYYADPNVFDVFSFPLIKGAPETALKDPFTIVLTEKMAQKYFANQNPIGQTLTVQDTLTLTVTGILKPLPSNLHFTFDFLISLETKQRAGLYPHMNWGKFGYFTYILLAQSTSPESIKAQVWDITRKYIGEAEDQQGFYFKHFLQPLTDIHLHSNMEWDISTTTPINHIYIFSSISIFILLIACINFMNLATARSITRAKEVGMRKVVGAYRKQLISQFLGEALLTTSFAFVIAITITYLILPTFNDWTGKSLNLFNNLSLLLKLIGLILFVGLLSGIYPAFTLSKFHPIAVLKGTLKTNPKGAFIRKGLVVFQFVISVVLIVGTLVINNQLTYMQSQNLGFDKEQIIVVNLRSKVGPQSTGLQKRYETIKAGFLNTPNVINTSASWTVPGHALSPFTFSYQSPSGTESKTMFGQSIDYDFIPTYKINLIAGRNFSKTHPTDEAEAILLNEQALSYLALGTPTEAIGQTITIRKTQHHIIGVVANFHHHGLHKTIGPLMMQITPNRFTYMSLKVRTNNMANTLTQLEQAWQNMVPNRPFEHFFLDQNFEKQYHTEQRLGHIFTAFSTLAIFIGCLGLFGLISFAAQQRTKEIGIRKVLGATSPNLVLLLSKGFITQVLIANLIAWPIAYYTMNKWLESFAYRVHLEISTFILSGFVTLLIALITISYQAIKAAQANPIDSLRYE